MKPEKSLRPRAVPTVLILGALTLGTAGAFAAPPAASSARRWPVAVKAVKEARIRIARGKRRQVVDLARAVAGCTGDTYDHTVNEEYPGGIRVEIADETEKGPFTYLLLLVSAPPNCNIEGECGAGGDDSTLVWLKVDKKLAVAGRQTFAISDCRAGRETELSESEAEDDHYLTIKAKNLPWNGDVLRIEYREREDAPRHLLYDRRSPDAGLQLQP